MNTENKKNNIIAIYVSIGKIMAMLFQFAMPLFLTRFLSKSDYGIYSQFFLIQGFLVAILSMGIQSNIYYFYPNNTEQGKHQTVWNSYLVLLMFGIIGSLIFLFPKINFFILGNELYELRYIVIACVICGISTQLVDPLSIVRNDKYLASLYHPMCIILKTIIVILCALIWGNLYSIISGYLVLEFFLLIFMFIYINCNFPFNRNSISGELLRKQITYSLPFGFAVLLNTICGRIDKLICVSNLTSEEYATYSIAFFGIPGVMQIYDSLCQVNVVNMTKRYQNNDIHGVVSEYKSFVVKTLSFSLPLILITFLFSPQIINILFSNKYIDSVPFFRVYILTFILAMFGSGTVLRAIGKTKLTMKSYLFSSAVCIPVTFLLIHFYGVWGAISSAVFNILIPKFFQLYYEMMEMNTDFSNYFPWRSIYKILIISIVILIPIILINIRFSVNIWMCIPISIAYIIICYLIELKHNVFIVDIDRLKNIKRR